MASTGLGVTIGSHSLRGVKLRRKGAGFVVLYAGISVAYAVAAPRAAPVDDGS